MSGVKWNLSQDVNTVHQTQVFSGGACNVLDDTGTLLRNKERDSINDWLTEQGIYFFDPQIHPDTHGTEYNYPVHSKIEIAARKAASINLYEVSPLTFGGITSFEIAADHFRFHEPMVIYYSDGHDGEDVIPAHSPKGHPLFTPIGIISSEEAMRAHYKEFIKNGNNVRKYLMTFAREMDTLTVTFDETPRKGDMVISPDRIHAAELFESVVRAASGERVFVNFSGGPNMLDKKGNPRFIVPENPPEVVMNALLDQYVDEGNELRRRIAELVEISVFVRVVYTQRSAIHAMEEVLKIRGLIK